MDFQLADLTSIRRSWGRGVIFRAPKWDTTGPLVMAPLMDTEGDIVINTNGELATLTLPELTGPAGHDVDYLGENPVIEVPGYVTDPALMALISPNGSPNAGRERRGRPIENTIAIFPENIFLNPLTNEVDRTLILSYTGGVWTLDGDSLNAEAADLLDVSFWLWRCVINRPPLRFRGGAGDDKKNIETVTIQGLFHGDMPNGHHLYTIGNPYTADPSINLDGMS